jgi:predicted glycoside hydrolase/deacetylase ChbG (UPF0249 family)
MRPTRTGPGPSLMHRLGYSSTDRVVIVHADDVGLCHASVQAYDELAQAGAITSASTMAPSGWFPAVARIVSESCAHDMGIHLTLNSEWADYRLRPLTGTAAASLCDPQGFFHSTAARTVAACDANQVRAELAAQVTAAHQAGMDLTHIDSHMLTLMHPRLLPDYLALSRTFHLPNALPRLNAAQIMALCKLDAATSELIEQQIHAADAEGLICLDAWEAMPLSRGEPQLEEAARLLDRLPEGLSMLAVHPAVDGPELRAIASDWPARVADAALLTQDAWRRALERAGVQVIGMRAVRQAMFEPVVALAEC